jgi:hypothetical protein
MIASYTNNMMQTPPFLKIWRVVLSNELYWYSGQKVNCFATFELLRQFRVANRIHVLEYFDSE